MSQIVELNTNEVEQIAGGCCYYRPVAYAYYRPVVAYVAYYRPAYYAYYGYGYGRC